MATHVKFFINNIEVNPPQNWKELGIECNFDREAQGVAQHISITEFDFVRENTDLLLQYKDDGLSTGTGVLEGVDFRIEIHRNGVVEVPFNGYIDLTKSPTFSNIKTTVSAVESTNIDWLNDVADSFTYEYLFKHTGEITKNDFVFVPYVLNSVPNYTEAALGVISVYIMAKEVKDMIQRIVEFVADLPVYYVFSTYIKLILYIIYLILVIIALVKLIKNTFLLIIQPVKYHAGMYVKDLLEKGAKHLGLNVFCPTFQTDTEYSKAVIVPEKYYNPINNKEKQILGFTDPDTTQEGYFKGTFGDLIRAVKTMINGKVIIQNNTLYIVKRDYNISQPQYTLPPIYQPYYSINSNEITSNILIEFQTDMTEKNTIQDYLGTTYQIICKPKRVVNSRNVLMKGYKNVSIPFALAKRKESLTVPEEIFDSFFKVIGKIIGALVKAVNAVIKVLNVIINIVNSILKKLSIIGIKIKFQLPNIPTIKMPQLTNLMSNRIGMMIIEKDLFTKPKILILNQATQDKNSKLHPQNYSLLSARLMWDYFYNIDSFVPSTANPTANQYIIKKFQNVPFSFDDYEKVKQNNRIFTSDGKDALITSLKWNPWAQKADIDVRIEELYTNNLTETYIEPDGK